jgi:starch-binding outer membrane protein, SusD/RagB family
MKTKYFYFILFILLVSNFGCKKFVQIQPPATELVTTSVFGDNSTATAAVVAVYTSMVTKAESYNLELQTGLLGDELKTYNRSITSLQYYTDAMTAVNVSQPWEDAYNYIYQANAIIAAVQGNGSLYPAISEQLLGEAKFIRAFWLFYLTNLYGDVPIVTTTNYSENEAMARTPRAQVYLQIISDLKNAKTLLNSSYVDASDTAVTTADRGRPNKSAAGTLLARVYLYTGDNADAKLEADSVIGSPLYSLVTELNSVFLANSNEAIWQLDIPLPTSINTPEGKYFILIAAPGSSIHCCTVSDQLLSSFEPGDQRRLNWIDSFQTATSPVQTYYYPYKYEVNSATSAIEDIMVLRLAELYLIRAEAEVNQGDLSDGATDLNAIRNRAGLLNVSDSISSSKQNLLTAILHERKVELFTEWGHRWLDLIRTGSADSVMSVVAPFKGGVWSTDEHQLLYPLPAIELTRDVNLVQNLGY